MTPYVIHPLEFSHPVKRYSSSTFADFVILFHSNVTLDIDPFLLPLAQKSLQQSVHLLFKSSCRWVLNVIGCLNIMESLHTLYFVFCILCFRGTRDKTHCEDRIGNLVVLLDLTCCSDTLMFMCNVVNIAVCDSFVFREFCSNDWWTQPDLFR